MPEKLDPPSGSITGRVKADAGDELEVSTHVGQVCGSCSAKCGVRQTPQVVSVVARATTPIQLGQVVSLDIAPGALAQISLTLYLLPAIGLLTGAFCAYSVGLGDLSQAAAGGVGLLLGMLAARFFLHRQYIAGSPLRAVQFADK